MPGCVRAKRMTDQVARRSPLLAGVACRPRILVVPGLNLTEENMKKNRRFRWYCKHLKASVDFVFADGPEGSAGAFSCSSIRSDEPEAEQDKRTNDWLTISEHYAQVWNEKGPFDGLLGYRADLN